MDISYKNRMHWNMRRTWQWLLLALVVVLLLVPLPAEALLASWPALADELKNFAHPVVFGWLAHLALPLVRARWPTPSLAPYMLVLGGALFFGLATEAAQRLTGRDSSWNDLLNDVLGAGAALLLHARAIQWTTWRRLALGLAAVAIILFTIAPLAHTVSAYLYRAARAPVLWQPEPWLFGRFAHWQGGRYPGLVLDEPFPDWRDWRFLEIDLEILQSEPMRIGLRVHDRHHVQSLEDRYNVQLTLAPGTRQILRIPLERIRSAPEARTQDMAAIRGVVLFTEGRGATRHLMVHEIRLAR